MYICTLKCICAMYKKKIFENLTQVCTNKPSYISLQIKSSDLVSSLPSLRSEIEGLDASNTMLYHALSIRITLVIAHFQIKKFDCIKNIKAFGDLEQHLFSEQKSLDVLALYFLRIM